MVCREGAAVTPWPELEAWASEMDRRLIGASPRAEACEMRLKCANSRKESDCQDQTSFCKDWVAFGHYLGDCDVPDT
jgi:hypothetical protein